MVTCLSLVVILTALFTVFGKEVCTTDELILEKLGILVNIINGAGFGVYDDLQTEKEENVFISPLTIMTTISMLYLGAKGGTAEELSYVRGYDALDDDELYSAYKYYFTSYLDKIDQKAYSLGCASALIVNEEYPLLPEYKSKMEDLFQAYVQNVDAARMEDAIDNLNSWISRKTKGMIQNVVDVADPSISMFMTSAAYFKGSWRMKFNPENTKLHPFYNNGLKEERVEVPMMHSSTMHRFFENEDLKAIELAYEGRNISMVILMMKETKDLESKINYFNADDMSWLRRNMYFSKVHLTLPKFNLSYNVDLLPILKPSVVKALTLRADFSAMTSRIPGPLIGQIEHKATISVSEEGSVAASYTSAVLTKMLPTKDSAIEFMVNRPFNFAICDTKSNMMLFIGRVNKMEGTKTHS